MHFFNSRTHVQAALLYLLALLPVISAATLNTVGAYACSEEESIITVTNFNFTFDQASSKVTYVVDAYSAQEVEVIGKIPPSFNKTTAHLTLFFFSF